jgi:hypothetical protein
MARMLRTMEIAFYAPLSQIPFKLLMEIVIGIDSKSMMEGLQQKMDKLGEQKRIIREKKITRASRFFISIINLEILRTRTDRFNAIIYYSLFYFSSVLD